VAVGGVDAPEVVDVDEEHRHSQAYSPRVAEGPLQPVTEAGAIGQVGQGIVAQLVCHPLFELLALGDVADVDHQALDAGQVDQVGDRHLAG
jgi:hypothetical protein